MDKNQSSHQIQPQLGLVCVTTTQLVRFRSLTRKRLLQMNPTQQADTLRFLYTENLQRLNKAIDFCFSHQIWLYRIQSGLLPFVDTELGETILEEFKEEIRQIGDRASRIGLRLVTHPPQFVVLNSDSPGVIENSIKILATQARIMDYLGQKRSPWAAINIHGGKRDRAQRLIKTIKTLPQSIRSRLTLENDEYAYGAQAILEICQQAGVPMVFDAHHHVVHEHLDSYEHESVGRMLAAARTTWEIPHHQLVHISNGQQHFSDRHHSDFIEVMPSSYRHAPWIEVEAKQKELAIKKLQLEWLPQIVTPVAG